MKRRFIISFALCYCFVLPLQAQRMFNVTNEDGVEITYGVYPRVANSVLVTTTEFFNKQYNQYDTIRIPATVTWNDTVWDVVGVNSYTFAECRALRHIELPEGITLLGAFTVSCTGISSFIMPSTVTTVRSSCFFGNEQLAEITLSPNLTELSNGIFSNCHRLRFLKVPEGVITIDTDAVRYCRILDSISLPSTLQEIRHEAFAHNISLSAITVHALVPPTVEGDVFLSVDRESTVLHVPAGCIEAYRNAPVWGEFLNIQDDAVGIATTEPSSLRWHTEPNAIVIESSLNQPATLYDAMGRQLLRTTLQGSQRLEVPHSGLYILRHGKKSTKIIVP